MSKTFAKILFSMAAIAYLSAGICYIFSMFPAVKLLIVIALIITALAFRGYNQLKGFTYTVFIVMGICLGMFFPQTFIRMGNFELKHLIVPFVQVTMLGMGAQMTFNDFKGVVMMPKGVLTGVLCHFTVMPLVGLMLSKAFNFSPEIAGGVVLIGCVPSAMASNVMSYLAKANLALAVTIGAVGTMLAPFLTPLLMQWLGGQYIEINVVKMMVEITNMIIVPIIAGFIFNLFYHNNTIKSRVIQMSVFAAIILITNLVLHFSTQAAISNTLIATMHGFLWFYLTPLLAACLLKNIPKITIQMISSTLAFVAMLGIVINTIIITASGRDSLMQVGMLLILSCFLHNVIGYTVGYSAASLMRLPQKDRRTVAFEVGMQNGGVATGLALQMGKIATVGLASAIFGPLQNLTGSALVDIFKRIPLNEEETIEKKEESKEHETVR